MRFLSLLVLAIFFASSGSVAGPRSDRVKPQLLADTTAVQPGKAFTLGVLFDITPEWHLYWKNPGDAGLPPTVTFTLPPGFTAGDVRFPVPTKFTQPGGLIAYGYTDQLLLTTTITPPADLPSTSPIEIKAALRWLVCDEKSCVPGNAPLQLSLPVSSDARPAIEELFTKWRSRFPITPGNPDFPGTVDTRIVIDEVVSHTADKPQEQRAFPLGITVEWKQPVTNVEFFPGQARSLKIQGMTIDTKENQTHITFTAELFTGQKLDVHSLNNVIAYTDAQGIRRGVEVNVPLDPGKDH